MCWNWKTIRLRFPSYWVGWSLFRGQLLGKKLPGGMYIFCLFKLVNFYGFDQGLHHHFSPRFENIFRTNIWGKFFTMKAFGFQPPSSYQVSFCRRDTLLHPQTLGWSLKGSRENTHHPKKGHKLAELPGMFFDTRRLSILTTQAIGKKHKSFSKTNENHAM